MRRVVTGGLVLLLLVAGLPGEGRALGSQSQSVTIHGEAQPVRRFSSPVAAQATNMALTPSSVEQNTICVGTLVDPGTKLQAASISLTLKRLCNRACAMSITTANGGLISQNASSAASISGFSRRVDYTAQVAWASSTSALHTAGATGQSTPLALSNGTFWGDTQMQITIDPAGAGNLPMLAGT